MPTEPAVRTVPAPTLVVPVRRGWLVPLLGVGLALAAVSAVWQLVEGGGWVPGSLQLDRVLDVDEDLSVLNWLTASTFLVAGLAAGLMAAAVAREGTPRRAGWWATAALLVAVSLDEAAGLHDPLTVRAEQVLRSGVAGAVAVLVVGAVAAAIGWRFLLRQPPPVRWRLLAAAGLVLLAAVGVDALGEDLTDDPAARLEAAYVAKATAEEALEWCAAVLALDAVLVALVARSARLRR